MLFRRKKKNTFLNEIKHSKEDEFKKIMLMSCIRLNNGKYQITYCLDYVASNCDYIGLLINSYVVSDTKLKSAPTSVYGCWCKATFNNEGHILYLSNYKK